MRRDEFSRRLMRETAFDAPTTDYPVFVLDGKARTSGRLPCPGVERYTIDRLLPQAEQCLELGIPAIAHFPGDRAAI